MEGERLLLPLPDTLSIRFPKSKFYNSTKSRNLYHNLTFKQLKEQLSRSSLLLRLVELAARAGSRRAVRKQLFR